VKDNIAPTYNEHNNLEIRFPLEDAALRGTESYVREMAEITSRLQLRSNENEIINMATYNLLCDDTINGLVAPTDEEILLGNELYLREKHPNNTRYDSEKLDEAIGKIKYDYDNRNNTKEHGHIKWVE